MTISMRNWILQASRSWTMTWTSREFFDRRCDTSQWLMSTHARQAAESPGRPHERVVTRIGCHLPAGRSSIFVCDVFLTWWRSRAFSAASAPVATDQWSGAQSSWLAATSANEQPLQRKAVPIVQHLRLECLYPRSASQSTLAQTCLVLESATLQVPIELAVSAPPDVARVLPVKRFDPGVLYRLYCTSTPSDSRAISLIIDRGGRMFQRGVT